LIRFTCPCCAAEFPWEAGLVETDAKRLGAVLGDMEPALARAAMSYLRLFKPPKTSLRLPRATKLLLELADLVKPGTVCRDERMGVRRPAGASHWIAGIEQMLAQADRLTLPLGGHGYLRQVVFALADADDAAAERRREDDRRSGRRQPTQELPAAATSDSRRRLQLNDRLNAIASDLRLGLITEEDAERRKADLRREFERSV
jgi:hypothetical protein